MGKVVLSHSYFVVKEADAQSGRNEAEILILSPLMRKFSENNAFSIGNRLAHESSS